MFTITAASHRQLHAGLKAAKSEIFMIDEVRPDGRVGALEAREAESPASRLLVSSGSRPEGSARDPHLHRRSQGKSHLPKYALPGFWDCEARSENMEFDYDASV